MQAKERFESLIIQGFWVGLVHIYIFGRKIEAKASLPTQVIIGSCLGSLLMGLSQA